MIFNPYIIKTSDGLLSLIASKENIVFLTPKHEDADGFSSLDSAKLYLERLISGKPRFMNNQTNEEVQLTAPLAIFERRTVIERVVISDPV